MSMAALVGLTLQDQRPRPWYSKKSSLQFHRGAVGKVVGNWSEAIVSGGEVNGLSDGRCGERLPAVDLSHGDLS